MGTLEHCEEREGTLVRIRRRRDIGGWKKRVLTVIHGRYLGDIPLAHVAVELVGVSEHCDEREGTRVRIGRQRDSGEKKDEYLLCSMLDTFETSHLLTSLLNWKSWLNTAGRERVRLSGLEGNEAAGEGRSTYCVAC